jgi:crotonobetainyl-CoA:carnitine CoA-transferase CaiB-like acyl-CoA transferase
VGPLAGTTVLDLTRVLSGPYCTMLLGDLGARVIKIERPGRGDDTRAWGPPFAGGESTYFLSINRNKESVTLDLQQADGRAILERLLARADVLVENFRPGTLARFGLDYATLAGRHPRLVYCSISGYGQTGPRRDLAGYDAVIQAEGGLMSITGAPAGEPYRLGLPITDLVAGLFAAQGITAALLDRTRTDRGRHIDVSMLDSVAALLTSQASAYFASGVPPARLGNGHVSIVPYDTFMARDGQMMLAVGNDDQWRRLCEVAGLDELAADARFATNPGRVEHRAVLVPMLERTFRTRDRAEWIARLGRAGVPCGEVRTIDQALADPQLEARGILASTVHPTAGPIRLVGSPIRFSPDPPGRASEDNDGLRPAPAPPPLLGEDTDAVLMTDLGLSAETVRDFRAREVI